MTTVPTVLLTGDAQADAIGAIFKQVPEIASRFNVRYEPYGASERSAVHFRQCSDADIDKPLRKSARKDTTVVTFPAVRFGLLWPLSIPNPYNKPELPKFPFGRFPYGDTFVAACLDRQVRADEILGHCASGVWGEAWPNLDELFRDESRRLTSTDAAHDVKIGSWILKHFRRRRLFWTIDLPADALLAELAKRLASAAKLVPNADEAIDASFAPREDDGLLSAYSVPIHRHVAEHFALEWYRADQIYHTFDGPVTQAHYFEALIRSAATTAV